VVVGFPILQGHVPFSCLHFSELLSALSYLTFLFIVYLPSSITTHTSDSSSVHPHPSFISFLYICVQSKRSD
jgi:hypothetical protein